MASLLKRKNSPSWWVAWSDRGVRRVQSAKTPDKAQASELLGKLAAREWRWKHGMASDADLALEQAADEPLREHFDAYLEHLRREARSAHHVEDVATVFAKFIVHAGDGTTLAALCADVVTAFLEQRRTEKGSGPRTWNRWRSLLDGCARWLVRQGKLDRNPIASVSVLKVVKPVVRRRALTADELRRLFAAADERGEAVGTFFRCGYYCGLRRGELEKLTWGAIDLERGVVTITPDVGKAKTRTDRLPLHAEVAERLRALRPAMVTPASRVFAKPVGHKLRLAIFTAAGIPTENAAGERVDFHALRATLATDLAAGGAAPITTQRLMRHANFAMTSAHYVRLGDDALRDGLKCVDSTKRPAPTNVARPVPAQAAGAEVAQDGSGSDRGAGAVNDSARARCTRPGAGARFGALSDDQDAKTRNGENSVETGETGTSSEVGAASESVEKRSGRPRRPRVTRIGATRSGRGARRGWPDRGRRPGRSRRRRRPRCRPT